MFSPPSLCVCVFARAHAPVRASLCISVCLALYHILSRFHPLLSLWPQLPPLVSPLVQTVGGPYPGGSRLMKDEGFRRQLLSNVAKVGNAIEEALGSAQDIEGCVEADGSITVVQTRPQM